MRTMKIKEEKDYKYPTKEEIKKQLDHLWEQEEMKEIKKIIKEMEDYEQ